jgi:TolA-binding protein
MNRQFRFKGLCQGALWMVCIVAMVAASVTIGHLRAQAAGLEGSSSGQPQVAPRLDEAYTRYLAGDYQGSIEELDRFMARYPHHENSDYARYLKAVSISRQVSGHDLGSAKVALAEFEDFLRDFPDSPYAEDASAKAQDVAEVLAANHMSIGLFYQERGELLAAVHRFQIVVREYPGTTQTPEAMRHLTESFTALGFEDIQPVAGQAGQKDRAAATPQEPQSQGPLVVTKVSVVASETAEQTSQGSPKEAGVAAEAAVQPFNTAPAVLDSPLFAIHLSSVRERADTDTEWRRLQQQFPDLLESWELLVRSVELEERGIYYRVMAGPFTDYAKAQAICAIFKVRRQHCLARRLFEDQPELPAGSA